MAKTCVKCKKEGGFLKGASFITIRGEDYCSNCAAEIVQTAVAEVVISTTPFLEGYKVAQYIDIQSVEVVIGTGVFSEIGGDVSDFFGARSTAFEKKLQKAKRTALNKLKYNAFDLGGNAVIGMDLDYTEFSGNRIGLIANGTVVNVEKESE